MQVISISETVSQLRQRRNGRTTIAEFINRCEWIDAIPLEKIKQAKEEMQKLRGCSCSCSDGIIDDVEDILDKLIESEG